MGSAGVVVRPVVVALVRPVGAALAVAVEVVEANLEEAEEGSPPPHHPHPPPPPPLPPPAVVA